MCLEMGTFEGFVIIDRAKVDEASCSFGTGFQKWARLLLEITGVPSSFIIENFRISRLCRLSIPLIILFWKRDDYVTVHGSRR